MGNIYVAGGSPGRISKYTPSGSFITSFGDTGTASEQLGEPWSLAIDSSNNVWVADRNKSRVQEYSSSGSLIRDVGTAATGCGDLQFLTPQGIAVDASDNVYLVDTNSSCVQKFSSTGTFITKWGSAGTNPTEFQTPRGIDIDSSGDVFVADLYDRVQRFESNGTFDSQWGGPNPIGNSQPDVAIDPSDRAYVGTIGTTFGGTYYEQRPLSTGLLAGDYSFVGPVNAVGLATDSAGILYAAFGPSVIKIDPTEPAAFLTKSAGLVSTGDAVSFDASSSYIPFANLSKFEWDLDGNGSYETDTGQSSSTTKTYDSRGVRNVGLRVTAPNGHTATSSTPLDVRQASPKGAIGITIEGGDQFTNDPRVKISARWPLFATDLVISNDGGFDPAENRRVDATFPWKLRSSGPERLPKTVYVRFTGGQSGAETYQDDIILDETAPILETAEATSLGAGSGRAVASVVRRYRVKVKAKDKTSGVGGMQITGKKKKPGKVRKYKKRATARSSTGHVFVRVRDRAGNFSHWKRAR